MAKIIGLGRFFPEKVRKNSDWSPELIKSFQDHLKRDLLDIVDHGLHKDIDQFSLDNIQREKSDPFLGASERRVVSDHMTSYDLDFEVSKIAIQGFDPENIGAAFSYSFMPDRIGLPSAGVVANLLGMKNAFGCHIETACSSQILQIKLATALVDSGVVSGVLLMASNLMTRGLLMGHPASPGIGDAATAILIGPDTNEGHKIINTFSRTHGEYKDAVVWRRKHDENQNWWKSGGDFYLGSYDSDKARELVQITAKCGADTISSALQEVGMSVKDLNFVVSVQPRKWINTAITRLLGMPDENSIETYEQYAHIGCCGPVVNLIEADLQGKIKKGDVVALYAQGAGFTRSASIIEW